MDDYKVPPEILAAQLEEYRLQFESGYADALIHALLLCAKNKIAMPDWVDWELHQAWYRFVNREAEDLGAAFRITWPKGKHKAAYLKKRRLKFGVYLRVKELHEQGQTIQPDLFQRVGEEFGIGKRSATEYYYIAKKELEHAPIAARPLLEPYRIEEDD